MKLWGRMNKKYAFYKQTEEIDERITAEYGEEEDWHEDLLGYFLIRLVPEQGMVEVAFVTPNHVIRKVISGKYAIKLYHTIVKRNLVTRLEHAAYLGKELYKAEMALRYGKEYKQDFPLDFLELPEAVKLERKS